MVPDTMRDQKGSSIALRSGMTFINQTILLSRLDRDRDGLGPHAGEPGRNRLALPGRFRPHRGRSLPGDLDLDELAA
ncbi:MAG TPA: hypothetical protein VJB88_00530, partial [Vicinamibacteria bacterium]|nr:hypothetical protein [Vicinamibacteria bacterium]